MPRNSDRTLTSATVDGRIVKVGDMVGFKSDHEQCGEIVKITENSYNRCAILHLHNPNGFGGEYLRYATETTEAASDCW